jgi:hypothetical protein
MRMCLALGKTLKELEDSMDWSELMLWMQYDRVEPIGEVRSDLRNGMLMTLLHNQQVDTKKHPDKIKMPIDFMPFVEKPKFNSDLDQDIHRAMMLMGAKTARVK